ncbi:metallophosphoesterase [Psittacicella gerlachiana]|uniref:Calcineurin-like phosphoesterase domain-containing protein n=1 Tax=Psittacicella gerlachiana TaxID=2028574 RepID=A0A3A1YLR0_9GAMM|nr:metallophosphoesterase [Psittacicella gerlachiana]RIY37930.1 hypothetical protein CKF59_01200 [Psittacicella gerlachiana]
MAKYLIGDIHGCADEFAQLLEKINFNPAEDELYLAGDLVGRGPKPKEVLDLAIKHNAKAVLGNYDLHFLACLYGAREAKESDNFDSLLNLNPEEKQYYASWLQEQGFVREDEGFYLVHASLDPTWLPEQITDIAQQAKEFFKSWGAEEFKRFFGGKQFYINLRELGFASHEEIFLRRFFESLLVFTICRFRQFKTLEEESILLYPSAQQVLDTIGKDKLQKLAPSLLIEDYSKAYFDLNIGLKGKPEAVREQGLYPWFEFARAKAERTKDNVRQVYKNPNFNFLGFKKPVYFGHWSLCNGFPLPPGFIGTDTSCVFGDRLTAYKLPEFSVNMQDQAFLLTLAQPIAEVKSTIKFN